MAKPELGDQNETDMELDYDADGWHWTTDAAHFNPRDVPDPNRSSAR